MLNGGSMIWGFCVYFVYMIPLETDVLRKHRFQKEVLCPVKGNNEDSFVYSGPISSARLPKIYVNFAHQTHRFCVIKI